MFVRSVLASVFGEQVRHEDHWSQPTHLSLVLFDKCVVAVECYCTIVCLFFLLCPSYFH